MKAEPIEGELLNEFAQIYRIGPRGLRGVAVFPVQMQKGQKLRVSFFDGSRKTIIGGQVNLIRLDHLAMTLKMFPGLFELRKEK